MGLEPDPRIRSESFAARLRPPCSHLSPWLLVKEDLALPSVDFKRNKNLFFWGGAVITNIIACSLLCFYNVLILMSWKAKVSRDPHLQRYGQGGVRCSTCIITVCLPFPRQVSVGLLLRSLPPFHYPHPPPGPLSQARVDLRVSPISMALLLPSLPPWGSEPRVRAFTAAAQGGLGNAWCVILLTLLFIGTRSANPSPAPREFPVGFKELCLLERRGEA